MTEPMNGRTWHLVDFDECNCGDYRHQHRDDGRGGCTLPNTEVHGFKPCLKFRLFQRAPVIPPHYAERPVSTGDGE